jgi:homoserine O-acetyltransferase
MNAFLSPLAAGPLPYPAPPRVPVPETAAREGTLELLGQVRLHHGGTLDGARIAWRLVGPAKAPVVCVLGGIGTDRNVCLTDDPRQSWWGEVAGPHRALDTQRFAVLSFDYLGSGPPTTSSPALSTYDQAEALLRLLNHLGVRSLRTIIGGSYGGMVALAFGERYPDRVAQLIVVSAADRPHPLATAWRSIQRRIVRLGVDCGRAGEGALLAAALTRTSERAAEELAARFGSEPVWQGQRPLFEVEQHLLARGAEHPAGHTPESLFVLSESLDLHRVDATRIFVPTTAVAVREDQLVPVADVRALVARLPHGRLHEISSLHGHDAFLKESDQWRSLFDRWLGSLS